MPLLILLPLHLFGANTNLYKEEMWKKLLHFNKKDKPSINTPTFLLSYNDFSAKNELEKTIEFFKKDKSNICKYPARYLWITRNSDFAIKDFTFSFCAQFNNYRKNTNPYNISLVFVTEDVSNPTSMMGHIFFKLDGTNYKNESVENAISFFTIIDTFNIPYLAIESTLLGMKGYFVLKPYKTQIAQYKDRNIWEYPLNINKEQMQLLYYHFWELKDIDIKYYFTGYNCATMVDDLLSIASKSYKTDDFNLWLTPKDVIKKASNQNLIKNTKVKNRVSPDKNPIYSQNDSQISVSINDDNNALYLSFLPASHTLFDDNRQYQFESDLKLGEISVRIKNDNVNLDELNLFSMHSLVPWNKHDKLSKELEINYTKRLDKKLKSHHIYNFSYSLGFTYSIRDTLFMYQLLGIGMANGDNKTFLYGKNQFGLMLYEIYNMKTILQYISYYNNFNSKRLNNTIDIAQSLKIFDNTRLDIGYQYNQAKRYKKENFRISLSYIF